MKFTNKIKSSFCAIAVTAVLAIPTASSALAAPAVQSVAANVSVATIAKPAFAMYGAIGAKWNALGGSTSWLGNPVGNQFGGLRNGGAAQYFKGGAIVWSPATGAKVSVGAIRSAWLSTGATNGKLAYPKTDEYAVAGGVKQDYEGGSITWNSSTGRITISYGSTAPAPATPSPTPAAPVTAVDNSPAGAKAYTKAYLASMGWGEKEYQCILDVWEHESNWNFTATNRWSGAYGIPQAYPASKLATAGADWKTNSQTQIKWGVSYVKDRYGSPCGAYDFWHKKGWY